MSKLSKRLRQEAEDVLKWSRESCMLDDWLDQIELLTEIADEIERLESVVRQLVSLSELVDILERWRERTGLLLSDYEVKALREARSLVKKTLEEQS